MKVSLTRRGALGSLLLGGAAGCLARTAGSGNRSMPAGVPALPRTSPEAAGIDPAAVVALVEALDRLDGLHSFMLLRGGRVAAQGWWAPYAPEHAHTLFSLSKSFTSTAVGLAVHDGLLAVDAPVVSFFPEQRPPQLSDNLAAMQVRHLLTMSTGHDKDATGRMRDSADGNWVRAVLALPVEHAPGSKFVYNSAATYLLSAIVQKVTGKRLVEFLRPRLFGPLGISAATWQTCPRGIDTGGWGLSLKTDEIARFGQLYLQRGRWEGRQLVPEAWVQAATTKQVSNGDDANSDWKQGYGYQFWKCRHGAFRGDGAFGQFCVVIPAQDVVLAMTSGLRDMQAVLNAVWTHLLPGLRPAQPVAPTGGPTDLDRRLAALSVSPPKGGASSPAAASVLGRSYRLEANEDALASASLTREGNSYRFTLKGARGEQSVACGAETWVSGTTALGSAFPVLGQPLSEKVAARGAWTSDDTFTIKICHYETPFVATITCRFDGDHLTVARRMNVGFGPVERPALVASVAPR